MATGGAADAHDAGSRPRGHADWQQEMLMMLGVRVGSHV